MNELIEIHEFVDDCDCHACALIARDKLRLFAKGIMAYWPIGCIDEGEYRMSLRLTDFLNPKLAMIRAAKTVSAQNMQAQKSFLTE